MSVYRYEVQRKEAMGWIGLCRSTTEDLAHFPVIARNPLYRILEDGKDVTSRYRSGKVASMSNTQTIQTNPKPAEVECAIPVMKPAQYRSLSNEDKKALQHKITQCLNNKMKRVEIFKELNISEATYDTIRADMSTGKQPTSSSSKPVKFKQRSLI